MKQLICFLAILSLAGIGSAEKASKQYEVGKVTPYHFTTTTTTASCSQSGIASTSCTTSDEDEDHVLYRITLADGTTHGMSPLGFGYKDVLKGLTKETAVQYRINHKYGVDYILILDARGKEDKYTFAFHDGLHEKAPKPVVGPAPVPGQ